MRLTLIQQPATRVNQPALPLPAFEARRCPATFSKMNEILLLMLVSFSVQRAVGNSSDNPCASWIALDSYDRSQFYNIQNTSTRAKCDREGFKVGWYRFTGRAGFKMPNTCIPLFRCGTEKPGWLHGKHPTVEEGTVKRKLCFHTTGDCRCEWSTHILVRNCSRYFVYRLMPTLVCNARYCGDGSQDTPAVSTTATPRTAATATPRIAPTLGGAIGHGDIASDVRCGNDEMEIILDMNNNNDINTVVDMKSIHMENSSCVPHLIDKTHALIKTSFNGCGTKFKMSPDQTEMIYYNYIYIKVKVPSSNSVIVRSHVLVFLIECRFSREAVISVVTLSPRKAVVFTRTDGVGNFTLQMDMYTDAQYSAPYDKYPVPINNNHRLHLQAEVKTNNASLVVFLEMCKLTPTKNIDDPDNHVFIEEGCQKDKTLDYKYVPAAVQRLSIKALAFYRNPSKIVYVHCKLLVCQQSSVNSLCAKGCPFDRRRRSASDQVIQQYLSVGPLKIVSNENTDEPTGSLKPDLIGYFWFDWEIGLLTGFIVCLVIFSLVSLVYLFLQSTRRRHESQETSGVQESSTFL